MKAVAHQISALDDPAKACEVAVSGPNHAVMVIEAKREAARCLKEPFANLRVSHTSTATVAAYERWTPHLGVQPRPTSWRMTVTVRLAAEIVKARREHARGLTDGEHPQALEDEE